jgi:type II secretion system protein H
MRRTLATGSGRGFTLLELMIVMAILVMVATLFPFALNRALPSRRITTAVERLVSMVREAQSASLVSGRPVTLQIEGHGLTAVAAQGSADEAAFSDTGHSLSFPQSTQVSLADPDGRTLTALGIYPDGSSRGGRFDVQDTGHRGAVVVSAVTGRVSRIPVP